MKKASELGIWRFHLNLKVRLILAILVSLFVKLKVIFVALRVDQGFVEVENEQFVKTLFFEVELNFIFSCDRGEFFYLLNNIYGLDHLH